MKSLFLLFSFLHLGTVSLAQPFRYIRGNDYDRDSIKLLKIKGYKEYTALHADTNNRKLSHIVEYDTNGNMIRNVLIDFSIGKMNQWTYNYSPNNLLLEQASFYPDTMTIVQRTSYQYDQRGNQTEVLNENYFEGKVNSSTLVLMCYNSLNQLKECKQYNSNNKLLSHYEYIYDDFGNKTEELVYSESGKLLYRRDTRYQFDDSEEMYGLPTNRDPELEELMKERTSFNSNGTRTVEDGYSIRIFNAQNILLQLTEKNFRYKWFEYTFY
jgi:hypothetical protein